MKILLKGVELLVIVPLVGSGIFMFAKLTVMFPILWYLVLMGTGLVLLTDGICEIKKEKND